MINNTIKVGIIGLIMLSASLFVFIPLALYFCSMLNKDSSNEQVIGGSAFAKLNSSYIPQLRRLGHIFSVSFTSQYAYIVRRRRINIGLLT